MRLTILAENAAGAIVGDDKGQVFARGAEQMSLIPDSALKVYFPVTGHHFDFDAEDDFPRLRRLAAPRFGLQVFAGFDEESDFWCVLTEPPTERIILAAGDPELL